MNTITKIINPDLINNNELQIFANLIKNGKLVAFPTETVYGLGANALDDTAVREIFKVKNRPANNPLIAHISDMDMLDKIGCNVPQNIDLLLNSFWPGAFTIILDKPSSIPYSVTANGETVAVRCPSHPIANELIRMAGVPIVAPSANLSGKPSPTCMSHVFEDLNGLVAGIIDSGDCEYGIESTVVIPIGTKSVKILRPGVITSEMISSKGFDVQIDKHVITPVTDGTAVSSPGMLYRHYAPNAQMELVRGDDEKVIEYIINSINNNDNCGVLCYDGEAKLYKNAVTIEYGSPNDPISLSKNLFKSLRKFNDTNVTKIYARVIEPTGVGLGIYNRMLRAASFNVKTL